MPPAPFSGVLATVIVVIKALPFDRPDPEAVTSTESLVRQRLSHDDGELHGQIRSIVQEELGPDFDVDPLAVRYGSVELLIVVSTVYKLIKNSNEVLENLEKAVERIRRLIAGLMARTVGPPTLTRARVDPTERFIAAAGPSDVMVSSQGVAGSALIRSGRMDATLALALANFVVLLALLVVVALKL
jgi:hypothetical protein